MTARTFITPDGITVTIDTRAWSDAEIKAHYQRHIAMTLPEIIAALEAADGPPT